MRINGAAECKTIVCWGTGKREWGSRSVPGVMAF